MERGTSAVGCAVLAVALAVSPGLVRAQDQAPTRVWIDADASVAPGGHELDDGLALIQAFRSSRIEVVGVSAVFGNAPLADTFPITGEIVRRFGPAGLSVYRGAAAAEDLGRQTAASQALAAALGEEPLTVLALGPVTNVATVVETMPELADRIEAIVAVAGRRPGHRFTVGTRADARGLRDLNFELDPRGFQALLDAEVPVVLAPFELSSKVWITERDAARLREGPAPLRWLDQPIRDWLALWRAQFGVDGFHPFDTLAVAWVSSLERLTCEPLPVEIQRHPDDAVPAGSVEPRPVKPYLIASSDLGATRLVTYCHDVTADFHSDLMARLLQP